MKNDNYLDLCNFRLNSLKVDVFSVEGEETPPWRFALGLPKGW